MKKLLAAIVLVFMLTGCDIQKTPVVYPNPVGPNIVIPPEIDVVELRNEIILQFSADWCGPCQTLKNVISGDSQIQRYFNEETDGYFIIDIEAEDENSQAWVDRANPQSIPLVVKYRRSPGGDWGEVDRFVGGRSASEVLSWLRK